MLFGVYKFPYDAQSLDFASALVEQGLGGLVIGLIFGKSNASQPAGTPTMKAMAQDHYGSFDVLRVRNIDKPVPKDHQVLVKSCSATSEPLHLGPSALLGYRYTVAFCN